MEIHNDRASHTRKSLAALKAAFPYTLPIFAGFWFLGLAYGLLMNKSGFAFYWPMVMAMTIFSGSVESVPATFSTVSPCSTSSRAWVGRSSP